MTPMLKVSAAVLFAAISTLPALAATAPAPVLDFAKVDTNKDGKVSEAELKIVVPTLTDDQFKAADTNKDGSLSADEFAAWAKTQTK